MALFFFFFAWFLRLDFGKIMEDFSAVKRLACPTRSFLRVWRIW
jgi:hypothetical protein